MDCGRGGRMFVDVAGQCAKKRTEACRREKLGVWEGCNECCGKKTEDCGRED